MEFPVDLLVSESHDALGSSAQSYMNDLLYSNPDSLQYFTLPSKRKIRISLGNVGFVPLYGSDLKHKVLALFAPEEQFTAVALFLADQWWAVEDILKTGDPSRKGLIKVESLGERVVLYVLNRIIYRTMEMSSTEVPFLCHGSNDYAKILWKNGEAVGFYSVKPKGSLCNNFVSQCYQLPVMDSIFVRKSHRGNSHGLQILEDFVDSFKDDELGLKYPLSQAMYGVCRQYLNTYPADVDLLWEVESVGGPYQRCNVASKLSSVAFRVNRHSRTEESEGGRAMEKEMEEENCLDITEDVVVINKHLKVAEAMDDTPISTRTRSSEHKRKRVREETEETAEESQPEKINRMEEPTAEAEPVAVTSEANETRENEEGEEEEEESTPLDAESAEVPEEDKDINKLDIVEVNGTMSVEREEMQEETAVAEIAQEEEEQETEEVPQEPTPVLQNGTAEEEEEMEGAEEEEAAQETSVDKETVDTPAEPEEPVAEVQEDVAEEKPEEEAAPGTEEEGLPSAVEEPSPEAQALPDDHASAEDPQPGQENEEAVDELAPLEPASPEEASASATEGTEEEGEGDDEAMETEEPCVVSVGVTDVSYQPPEGEENQPAATDQDKEDEKTEGGEEEAVVNEEPSKEGELEEEEAQEGEEENATTTEDEERGEGDGRSSDEVSETPSETRVLRGRTKTVLPTPKRKSKRLSRAVVIEEVEEVEEEEEKELTTGEEEEKVTSTEEEKVTTEEEEEAGEKSSVDEEDEEPPVIDRRVLRRKTKVIQSTPRRKNKRRSKN
ncbi:soluble lamin-associated protein of 75 kDa [Chanos chanos]|uniref:Soluble lamin-associated protein of 75 kDa n=1 Tax=Chanos chanos TaxID=29144 RepID=A0A6J2UVX1_CHACN|nr:soluble lamin-associated protein of 75 kDa-like [Chanos chanos]